MLRLAAGSALSSLPHTPVVLLRHASAAAAAAHVLPTSTPPGRYPTRGGQNLTDRYRRLEKSVRGKGSYQSDIAELSRDVQENDPDVPRVRPAKRDVKTFMGFVIPEEPKPPGPDECCMSGCAICVQDLYIEALDEYKKATDSVRASLNALHIPEDRWPPEIQTTGSSQKAKPKLSPVYDAFAELERKLAEKHQAESHAGALPKPPAIGRPRKRKEKLPDVQLLYEGIRWVLFSNR